MQMREAGPTEGPVLPPPTITVVAVIPAHNEADRIAAAVRGIRPQVDRVVVVDDRSTDDTARVAAGTGAEVFTIHANAHKKAGALNQALTSLLAGLADTDFVFVQDADSVVAANWIERALEEMNDTRVGAVGGIFVGEAGAGLLGEMQRNEYTRYARDIARKKGRAMVLTGTASLFRVGVLRQVATERGARVPGVPSTIYDTAALTEDNEITLGVKTLGHLVRSPKECTVETEIMPSWRDLWKQRLRWQRGAVENLRTYGITRTTLPYLVQQIVMIVGLAMMWLYLVLSVLVVAFGTWRWSPFWLAVGGLFALERVVTVARRGWRAMALALLLVPEMIYDLILQAVIVRSLLDTVRGREATWHHVAPAKGGV